MMKSNIPEGYQTEESTLKDPNFQTEELTLNDRDHVRVEEIIIDTDPETESQFTPSPPYSSYNEISKNDEADTWPMVEDDGPDYEEVFDRTLKFLCQCDSPVCNIGDTGELFRDMMMKKVKSSSCIPSADEIMEIFVERYKTFELKFRTKLEAVDHVSLSCNFFNAVEGNMGIILHAHFIRRLEIEKEPKPEKIFLGFNFVDKPLDKKEVCDEIQRILNRFNLPSTKITSVCTDGSPFMEKVIEQLFGEGKSVPCLAIALHTIVKNALDADANNIVVERVLEKVVAVCTYVVDNNQELFDSDLLTTEEYENLEESLALTAPTKWNSVYIMVKNLLDVFPRLEKVVSNSPDLENVPEAFLDPDFEVSLMDLVKLLSFFAAATNEVYDNGGVTGSIAIPLINCLRSCLQSFTPVHDAAKILRERLLVSLEASIREFSAVPILCKASFFDPRFKKMYLTSNIANRITEECCAEVKLQTLPDPTPVAEEPANLTELWKFHDEHVAKQKNVAEQASYCEFKSYEHQTPLSSCVDPLQYWWCNQTYIPSLTRTAMKNLTVCCCSEPIEKFSDLVNGWYLRQINELGEEFFFKYWDTVMERIFLSEVSDEHWEEVYGKS